MRGFLRTLVARRFIENNDGFLMIRPRRTLHRKHFSLRINLTVGVRGEHSVKRYPSERNQSPALMARTEPLGEQNILKPHRHTPSGQS